MATLSAATCFQVGSTFDSADTFFERVKEFEEKCFVKLYKRSSRTIESTRRRATKKHFNDSLTYAEVDMACIHGGKNFKSTCTGKRPSSSTFQMKCPFALKVRASQDGEKLVVTSLIDEHNHDVSEVSFRHLPHQRKMDDEQKKHVKSMLEMKVNKKLVQQHIRKETGRFVSLKDLHNMCGKEKEAETVNLETVVNELRQSKERNIRTMAASVALADVEECFLSLAQEARELYLDSKVPEIETPSPLQFYRNYVAPNKPAILSDFTAAWPALHKWDHHYLRQVIGDLEVTVAVTPNGYADAVKDGCFVMPEERLMTVNEVLDILEKPESREGVYYVQKQNSNLTEEFQSLMRDIEVDPSWGTEVFGKSPDAVNMWIGDRRAITSMHRDHYENLYCVISGWKKFILIPPSDLPFVPYETYPAAHYKEVDGKFCIVPDMETGQVPWIAVDPLCPDLARYPKYRHCRPVEVTVHAGQTLYLPSLWFHHVQQSQGCIAVNLWYDMEFDIKYNYYKFVENIAKVIGKS